ncbi:uncharacterized protein LOC131675696 [Phymastichus coffea]|uniref:uncharacterized protein LOC131675696 n=1 Tax=Phymastichus coffea TaxID=108790 RepID=UPI00273BDA72|nr:uncharacterized protein LOC131675696 [Phymastichus coffea]
MALNISDSHDIEDIKIENNIVNGVHLDLVENPNIGELIIDNLNRHLDHIAQIEVETDKETRFADMKDKSSRCGLWMQNEKIGLGDIIIICSHNHSDVYVPIFAAFYLGASVSGWDYEISLKSAQHLIKFFKPKLIFSCESAVNTILEAAKLEQIQTTIIVFGKHSNVQSLDDILENHAIEKVQSFQPRKVKDPNTTAIIVLTSGSTSAPKGVIHSYKNVSICIQTYLAYPFKNVCLWYSTVYWVTGMILLLQTFFALGTRIIHKIWNVDDFCRVIQKYKVQRIFAAPTVFNHLCKSDALTKYNLESLEYVCIGGSKLSAVVMKVLREKLPKASIVQVYGSSETNRLITSQSKNSNNLNTVGYPAPNTQVKIVDVKTKETLGANQPGEICVKQTNLMLGYFNNLELTKQVIDEQGWLHLGDEGFYDNNGEITIIGRYKDMIKCRNFCISPTDLEDILLSHPAVVEVAVVPIPHSIDVEQPIAFVKRRAKVSEEELVNMTLVLGENTKLRGGVEFVDELPKLPTGKIDKQQLKKLALTIAGKRSS